MGGNAASLQRERELQEANEKAAEVSSLRQTVFKLFQGQQLLLVGYAGVGKSSLINSINHVINLAVPMVSYQEVAAIAAGEPDHGTLVYRSYSSDKEMYHALESGELTEVRRRAPTFFDVAGVVERLLQGDFDFKNLLTLLVKGKVEEFTQMVEVFNHPDEKLEKFRKAGSMDCQRAWSMLCVVALSDGFPGKLLEHVAAAVKELCPLQGGANVFVIFSKGDTLADDVRQLRLEDYKNRCEAILSFNRKRMFEIQNYLPSDWQEDTTMKVDLDKEKQVLVALHHILQQAYRPRWTHKDFGRENAN